MTTDLFLTDEFDIARDDTGDYATVDGESYARQRLAIVGRNVIQTQQGGGLTSANIEEVRAALEDELNNLPMVTEPATVVVSDRDDQSVSFRTSTLNIDLTLQQ